MTNEITTQSKKTEMMTTRELAETLRVGKRTVQETANRLLSAKVLSHLETRSVVGGKTFVFTEEQATLIKQEIQKHHNLVSRQVDNVATEPFITVKDENGQQTVSARELHEKLTITERFSNWFARICAYGFKEGFDYLGCKVFNTLAKQELQDYQISIEMAKQICMIQRSDKGKIYREYFLNLEKAWNSPEAVMARALRMADQTLSDIQKKLQVSEGIVNRIANGKGCFSMNQAAKALSLPYGNRTLFRKLREDGCLNADNSPTQKQIKEEHFKVVVKYVSEQVGNKPVTLVTGKGLVYLAKKFNTQIDETVQADA